MIKCNGTNQISQLLSFIKKTIINYIVLIFTFLKTYFIKAKDSKYKDCHWIQYSIAIQTRHQAIIAMENHAPPSIFYKKSWKIPTG
jgi:flagellar motor component MotA